MSLLIFLKLITKSIDTLCYEARVVDYDSESEMHTVVWLDEWTYTSVKLGRATSQIEGIHRFWLSCAGNRRALLGKRIILKPRTKPWFVRDEEYNAVVVAPEETEPGMYHVFCMAHRLIVTDNLGKVKYTVCDALGNEVEEGNGDRGRVRLDAPPDSKIHFSKALHLSK